jgi:hypothetical protein
MPGIAEIALGAAPIAGGALFAAVAGNFKGPDYRAMIKQDLELLEMIPPESAELRAALQRSIDERIDDLIVSMDKSRQLRQNAIQYKGDWRDFVVFLCVVLFTVIWWNVDHDRGKWIVMFVFLILLSILTGIYAVRGLLRTALDALRGTGRSAG